MSWNILNKINLLHNERMNLILAREDFKKCLKSCITEGGKNSFKIQYEIANARLVEFDRILSMLDIKIG